jgi:hypothetical protein
VVWPSLDGIRIPQRSPPDPLRTISTPSPRSRDACNIRASNQLHPVQAGMPVLADDDVVVHGDPKRFGNLDDRFGHLDVGL